MFVEIKNMNSISSSSSYSSSTRVMNKPLSQSSLFRLRYYNCNCNCNNISSSSIPFHSNFPPNNSMHFLLSLFFFFFFTNSTWLFVCYSVLFSVRLAVVSSSRLPLKCASSSTNFSDPTPNHSSHPTKVRLRITQLTPTWLLIESSSK